MRAEAPWYTNAVIYGVDVSKFADGNGDGIGDFVGLADRLPYLRELGVTCLWLLPFYKTPARDNGYDISDYFSVDQRLGSLAEFTTFMHKAGEHGIRIIADLVVNHTSDEHPWFVASRNSKKSVFRDYYIWSEDPPPVDVGEQSALPGDEDSVWQFDETAQAYYFHKFRHFQPELNIANPDVRAEILRIADFWISLGVSGFRVDAAPFVMGDNGFERAKPSDPHGLLRGLHDVLQARRPDGLLLGEVNLEHDKLAEYFGRGDQLGMLYSFVLTAYLFTAMARQEAAPVWQGLDLMPEPPTGCTWANLLRNSDELSLSRVSEEIRNEVFEAYAPREDMIIYGRGVRRRLAPLLNGDQRRIALAFSLMLSLPGTPLLYYGDEIGLGDDLSRPGREAVRVPMQWNDGRNGGFSPASKDKLAAAVVSAGPFSYKRINVAAQQLDEDSLFNQVRKLIALRRTHAFMGTQQPGRVNAGDEAILAQSYDQEGPHLLLLHNLSGRPVTARVHVRGKVAWHDLLEGQKIVPTSAAMELPLQPYGYRWLERNSD